jgi:hypothetical protein
LAEVERLGLMRWKDKVCFFLHFSYYFPAFQYTSQLMEIVSINPYSIVDVYLSCQNAGVDGYKYGA